MTQSEINEKLDPYYRTWEEKGQILTVFVTTYKRPYYLKLALESIINQTYKNFYIIVLDNMSRDETKSVVKEIGDDRLIYIERESTKEVGNFQFAFQLYKTKYIMVLHDDDTILPSMIEEEIGFLETNNDCVSVSACANIIDSDGRLQKEYRDICCIREYYGGEYLISYLRKGREYASIVFPTAMYRRSFYGEIGMFVDPDVGPSCDQFIWFQTERFGGKIAVIQKGLINYRVHQNQDSVQSGANMSIRLLNFLVKDEYYRVTVLDNARFLSRAIKTYFVSGIEGYEAGRLRKDDLKKLYKSVDRNYICGRSKLYMCLYKFLSIWPNITVLFYKLMKRERRNG